MISANWDHSIWKAGVCAAYLAASACATGMSQDECAAADWRAVGENDGLYGETTEKFDARAERCREFGFPADIAAWRLGYDTGLSTYCTPQGGFDAGSAGQTYRGVCASEFEPAFLEEFNIGSRLFALNREYDEALTAYDDAIAALDKHQRNLRGAINRRQDPVLSHEDREIARQDEEFNRRELERLEYDLPMLEREVDQTHGGLDDYRAFVDRRSR